MAAVSSISAEVEDWSREHTKNWWMPGFRLLNSLRDYQELKPKKGLVATFRKKICVLRHRFWSVVAGADIPLTCNIAGGLKLTHPSGVVIHPRASIGPNCLILQQVTIVADVIVGGQVDIGAGAKIVRPVRIGNHVKIGANAVVLSDIPDGATAVGIPAKVVKHDKV